MCDLKKKALPCLLRKKKIEVYGAPSLCWPVLEAYVAGQYLGEKLAYEKFETGFIKKPDDQESIPLVKII